MVNFSQNEEQQILERLITNEFPKLLVDVGANDGVTFSNSYAFYKKNWTGLSIEANPLIFKKLKKNLSTFKQVKPINVACANYEGESDLFLGNDKGSGLLSTLCTDNNSWFEKNRTKTKIPIHVQTLENLLSSTNFPQDFSILMVDTEGLDLEVLEGLNFNKHKPRIIVTEEYKHNLKKHNAKYELLKNEGYLYKHKTGCNTIWVHKQNTNQEDIFSHLHEIEQSTINYLKSVEGTFLNYDDLNKYITNKKIKTELIKRPKWEDDALIFRIRPATNDLTYDFAIKIHEDKYPLANHIYNKKELLNKISLTNSATKIEYTKEITNSRNLFRLICYEYEKGVPLGNFLGKTNPQNIPLLRTSLKYCVKELLESGVNVFVRDLDDFLVSEQNDKFKTILTDYNALMDCSNSNKYSRKNVMQIINCVIDSLVNENYKPFISQRPTLTNKPVNGLDLRF